MPKQDDDVVFQDHDASMTRPHFAPGSTVTMTVKNRSGKKPLAQYLGARLGVVEPWAVDLLASGHVKLNGSTVGADDRINLSAGPHELEIHFPVAWPKHMAATEMPLDVLYEDGDLVVLNKPAGIVVHPARGHLDNQTLQNGMRHRYRHLLAEEATTIGSPHRLDKDTSGAIVFALNRVAYTHLVDQFSAATPHKRYLAVLDGHVDFQENSCLSPIGPDPERKGVGTIVPVEAGGKTARSDFRIIERGGGWALADVTPHTGRPHQIRVHAASLGCPLAGDRDYNPSPDRLGFTRQALHAAFLAFIHPISGERIEVHAPLADDIAAGLDRLREARPCR
ncbi:MAG: RluA family pseudouridine synthase [Planctomycetaceae bacterium]|nr:RluA family pseudouridine synthase [Planctomycetaceae bacterium]